MKYLITSDHAKERLDKFLTSKLEGFSRSQIQKMIKKGEITVNGKTVTPHNFLKENDKIEVGSWKSGAGKKENKKIKLPKFRVIKETKDYLVIEKPAGVVVHGAI